MRSTTLRAFAIAASVCCALFEAGAAGAASRSSSSGEAATLFRQGRHLMAARRYDVACAKLQQSYELRAATTTGLVLAQCLEREGKIASAWLAYRRLIEPPAARLSARTRRVVRERLRALGPRVPKLVVIVPPALRALDGLTVTRDGEPLDPESMGTAVPVDPGTHTLVASAEGRRPWRAIVELSAGRTATVTVGELPPSTPGTPGAEPAPAQGVPAEQSATREQVSSPSAGGGQRVLGGVVAVLGAGALAVGGVFLGNAFEKNGEINRARDAGECAGGCDAHVLSLASQRDADATVGIVGLSAGGALLVTGAIVFFTAPGGTESAPAAAPASSGLRVTSVGMMGLSGVRAGGSW